MLNQELVLTIMNEIEDLIYVADVNTYDLLYMNERGPDCLESRISGTRNVTKLSRTGVILVPSVRILV